MTKQLKYSVLLVCLLAFTTTTAMAAPTRRSPKPSTENISEYAQFGFRLGGSGEYYVDTNVVPKDVTAPFRNKSMTGYVLGPSFGIYGEYALFESFLGTMAGAIELNYARGGKYDTYNGSFYNDLMGMALLSKVYPHEFGERFCIYGGIQFEGALRTKQYDITLNEEGTKVKEEKETTDEKKKEKFSKEWSKYQVGGVIGGEFIFNFDALRFKLGSRVFRGALNQHTTDRTDWDEARKKNHDNNHAKENIMNTRYEVYVAFDFSKLVQ